MKPKLKRKRPSWDEYFLEITQLVAKRSTCLRRQVGAVIVKDKRIISTGYNGAPRGIPHCAEVGCIRQKLKIPRGQRHELCRGLHAEQNALLQAAYYGIGVKEGLLYSTHQPCSVCAKMIVNAGIKTIVILSGYPDKEARELFRQANIEVKSLKK